MKEEHPWHFELAYMRDKVCWALDNIDDLSRRSDVRGQLEVVVARLRDLCDVTKGEVNDH